MTELDPSKKVADRYLKREVLGEGTYGVVYKAIDTQTGQTVAIKKIWIGKQKEGVNFTALREIKLLKELKDPNIIELIDWFPHKGNLHLVFEFMETDLEAVIRDRNIFLSPGDIKSYLQSTLKGLAHCHKKWVLHRDMKPNNLLIGPNGQLKLADFGLARIFGSPDRRFTHQVFARWYRAPELLFGTKQYGPGVDVWAAACIFAELLLRRPFLQGSSDIDQLGKIFAAFGTPSLSQWPDMLYFPDYVEYQYVPAPPLRSLFPMATDDALDLLSKMFTYDPKERISVQQALEHRYFSCPPPPTDPEKLPRPAPKREIKESDLNPHEGPIVLSPARKSRRIIRDGFEGNSLQGDNMDDNHAILKQTVGDNTGKSDQAMSLDFSVFGLKPPNRPTINRSQMALKMKRLKRKGMLEKVLKMKRQKKSDTDRLSALPDHLLLHIIQFMITKHSAQTCVLSKRWKNLWKCVTNIKLHHLDLYNGVIFDKFVSGFLSGRDNSIPLHSISYMNGCMNYPFPPETNIPVEIMEYAASHNVQQLEINSQIDHISNLELPPSIFNCGSLTSLNLCLWNVNVIATIMFPKSLNLPALKTLRLACFKFFTSDNGYAEPFSTCNMLSKLAIVACYIQDDAQGLCISNFEVSNLAIGGFSPHTNIHKVILRTPKVTSLTVNGIIPAFPAPSTCNLTLLEELKFDCPHGKFTMGEDIYISWLHLLATVERLTLNILFLESMVNVLKNNGSTTAQLPSFVKLKSLKVESCSHTCDESVREMVTYLLQNSPPPSTFLISKETDPTFDGCYFIGFLIPKSCQEDPTVQRAKVIKICEKCGHGEATYYTIQTREGKEVFYTCASCDHEFQEYI